MFNPKTKIQSSNLKSNNIRHRSYYFSVEIILFAKKLKDRKIFNFIIDQLLRAATSIAANLIEAKGSGSKREFARCLQIALKSANETKYWLCLIRDSKLYTEPHLNQLLSEATEISNMIGSSLLTIKGKKKF